MSRHDGTLSKEYQEKLSRMSLSEVMTEAARFRSDGRRCGTATALILRWAIRHTSSDATLLVNELYQKAWNEEKALRLNGQSSRPAQRPATGGRTRRRDRDNRHSFAYSC